MQRAASLFILLLLVLAGASGCSTFRDPVVESGDAVLMDRSEDALQIGVPMQLSNPNDEALKLLQFDYTLVADGRLVFRGRRAALATLGQNGTRLIVLPAVVPFESMGWETPPGSVDYRLSGSLLYVTPGALAETLLDIGLRRPRMRIVAEGTVQLQ
ncbi:MAG: hypothetical protein ACYTGC_05380 [Planctomycetota bacterium]